MATGTSRYRANETEGPGTPSTAQRSRLSRVVGACALFALALPITQLAVASPASAQSTDPYSALTYGVTSTIAVGNEPIGVAVDASTDTVYVANNADDTVSVISGATNSVTDTITLPAATLPYAVAVDSATDTVYVANDGVGANNGSVSVIDGANDTVGTISLPADSGPTGVDFDPVNNTVYVGDAQSDRAIAINAATNAVINSISVGAPVNALTIDASSDTVYAGTSPDIDGNSLVAAIDGSNNEVTTTFSLAAPAQSLAFDSSLGYLYVSTDDGTAVYNETDSGSYSLLGYVQSDGSTMGLDVDQTTDVAYVTYPSLEYPQDGVVIEDDANDFIDQINFDDVGIYEVAFTNDEPIGVAADEATDTAYVINNLPNAGGEYTLSVLSASPIAPAAPSVAAGTSARQATVTVAPPSAGSGGTPTSYTVTATDTTTTANGGQTCSFAGASGSCTVEGLTGGDTYTFTATADDAVGTSAPSDPSQPWTPAVTDAITVSANPGTTGPVAYGVTVSGDAGIPTGTVDVSDGDGNNCSVTLSDGSGSCSILELAAGSPYAVTATYEGSFPYALVTAGLNETVTAATPTVTLTSSFDPEAGLVAYTFSVLGNGPTPTGSVSVADGAGGTCSANLTSGGGSCSIAEGAASSPYVVTATYVPGSDLNYGSASQQINETVTAARPTVTISGQSDAITGAVTYTASVTGGGAMPTGTVEVSDGDGGTCVIELDSGGGNCAIAENAADSPYSGVTGEYTGDDNYLPALGTTSQSVSPSPVSVNVTSKSGPTAGWILYTVSITGAGGAAPTGTVTVGDASSTCTVDLSTAEGCILIEGAGTYAITASYSGDANYSSDTGSTSETVAKAAPTTVASVTPVVAKTGAVTYHVVVNGHGIAATGTVSVQDGAGGSCTITLALAGKGDCVISEHAGSYDVTESYTGDANHTPADASLTEVVGKRTPPVTTAVVTNPAVTGLVSYRATVSGEGTGIAPTGTVTVSNGQGGTCTVTLNQKATGTCAIRQQGADSPYGMTETYNGDSNWAAATATSSSTIGRATPPIAASYTTAAGNPDQVTFKVVVAGSGGGIAPTGVVTVTVPVAGSNVTLCSIVLRDGQGSCTTTLGSGDYSTTFNYGGDGNFASVTGNLNVTVA